MSFSVKLEAVSMLIIAIIALFHFGSQTGNNLRSRLFSWCLALSEIAIFLDIMTTITIADYANTPLWVNILVNSLYFIAINTCLSFVAAYCFYVMLEHAPDNYCLRVATKVIIIMYIGMMVIVIANIWTGWLFSFHNGIYVRGKLNRLGYLILVIELSMLCMCYFRNRTIVSRAMHKLMQALPPFVSMFVVVQLFFPDILLNGTIAAMANLILYISFQNNRISEDALTELPDRRAFVRDLASYRKKGKKLHLIMVHLNQYENVNRKYGMAMGDEVLYTVARYFESAVPTYQAYRFRNTRFILMGKYISNDVALQNVKTIARHYSEPIKKLNMDYVLDTKIAHMVVDDGKKDENEIAEQLEYAVLSIRETEGTNVVLVNGEVQKMFERREYVTRMVKKALAEESFEVYYQPVYDCRDGNFHTAESLLRLFGEKGEMIGPNEFIPLAEKNGMIDEITWMVLKKVCKFMAEHPELPLKTVSVNMSIQQLEDYNFVNKVRQIRTAYGIPAECIRIEITERVMAENPRLVQAVMNKMAEEGIRFYLDDFGIGYSNLASVISLPFETVKLDSSIIRDIDKDEKMLDVVRLLVPMLHNAGFVIVAEGIETQKQSQLVKELEIDRIQGFYYAKPMSEKNLHNFLMK